jgi:hypothetical protein
MAEEFFVVENYTTLMRLFAKTDRETRLAFRADLRAVAAPVQADARTLALARVPRMPRSPKWAEMRTGITQKLVYVVPRQKGVRGRGPKARPKLAKLMLDRAMNPALERNRGRIEARFGQTLDRLCAEFNGSGNA